MASQASISVEGIVDLSEIRSERLRAALLYPAAMTASAQVETSHASVQQLAVSLCPLRERGSKFRIAPYPADRRGRFRAPSSELVAGRDAPTFLPDSRRVTGLKTAVLSRPGRQVFGVIRTRLRLPFRTSPATALGTSAQGMGADTCPPI